MVDTFTLPVRLFIFFGLARECWASFCLRRWSHQATLAFVYVEFGLEILCHLKINVFWIVYGNKQCSVIYIKPKDSLQKTEYLSNPYQFRTTEFDSLHICPDFSSVTHSSLYQGDMVNDNFQNENKNKKLIFSAFLSVDFIIRK